MTDDLKERLLSWHPGQDEEALREEAVARITDLEAKLQRLGRELNLAKYGEPDFAWEIHKNAVADLEARLAAAEAGEDALAEGARRLRKHSETQMRTADYHGEECKCWRCAEDALFAALAAYEARREK
jgi:hypothetical protein